MGVGLPPRGGSLRPPRPEPRRRRKRRRLGRARERHSRASYERGDARHGGAGACRGDGWGRGGGYVGGGCSARRAPKEEETRVFHLEVGDYFPSATSFRSARA
jgi:hypothetical protein